MTIKIQTPDGHRCDYATEAEARAFVNGFISAMSCFGIWKDGVQTIGCLNKPIDEYRVTMIQQLRVTAETVQHGKTCQKAAHTGIMAYLHDSEDDRPYDVDGVSYCGRCHWVL